MVVVGWAERNLKKDGELERFVRRGVIDTKPVGCWGGEGKP